MLFLIDIAVSIYKLILIFVEIYFLTIYYSHFYTTFLYHILFCYFSTIVEKRLKVIFYLILSTFMMC